MSDAPPPVPWAAPVETVGPAPGVEFAPHGARIVAYLIDGLILLVVDLILMVPFFLFAADAVRSPETTPSAGTIALFVVLLIVMLLLNLGYFPYFWQRSGQTPGMRPFDLWVVRDQDGSAFGWGTALLRLVGLYVASAVFYLGFIWIFIDQRHRGWHDLIAGTVVIRRVGAAAR